MPATMQAASTGVAMQRPQLASATFKLMSFKHQIASSKPAVGNVN